MDKLEQYLEQVCRSIGGPRSLRQHVRQELREHLLDAVAQHRAAGLSEADALARALEEFGKPEDVRLELEATHGHRMMAVVIDKALQWKEMTMRAKWLWTTGAYLSLALVIALEVLLLAFIVLLIIPKFQKLLSDGIIDHAILDEQGTMWMPAFLNGLRDFTGGYTTLTVIVTAAAWGLFEWRVKSENKPFMRLSALGTAAVVLMVVIVLTVVALLISFTLGAPAMGRLARPFALEQVATIDTSVGALEQSLAMKDWEAMQDHASQTSNAMTRLAHGPALASLTAWNAPPTVEELRADLKAANASLVEAQQAIREKDAGRLETALQSFRRSYSPVRDAAKRPPRDGRE